MLLFSCSNGTTKEDKPTESDSMAEYIEVDTLCSCPQCVIILQPYEDFTKKEVEKLLPKLQKTFNKWLDGHWEFKIANSIPLPKNSYVKERNRYKVTPILNYETKRLLGYEVIIGLTHKDICTDIHGKKNYGIVGISRPLKQVSLVSDKRIKNKSLMWKVILHEFIHTFYGAKHCPNEDPTCFMKDAKGHGNFEIQDKLCKSCKH
jgi:archaemetzincin